REEIRQQRRRDGDVGRLADADQRTPREQLRIAARQSRQHGRETPDEYPERDRARARAAIAPRPEHRRGEHVHQHEGRHQPAELRVRQRHGPLELRQQRGHDVAIEVVEQVDRGEDAERPDGRARRRCGGAQGVKFPRWTRAGLYPRPQAGASFRRSRYWRTGSRNPSLLVMVVPPATTRMKSPRGVRLTSRTWLMLIRHERLMRSIGWLWKDFSACCRVLRAW